jgi:hypothetical protein
LIVAACASQADTDDASAEDSVAGAAAADFRWHPLGTWSGSGDRQTESFDVRTGTLKLVWETTNERAPGAGRLQVELHSSISGRPLQTIVDTVGVGFDSTYVADEPRVSYLVITSAGMDWRVRLEEGVR